MNESCTRRSKAHASRAVGASLCVACVRAPGAHHAVSAAAANGWGWNRRTDFASCGCWAPPDAISVGLALNELRLWGAVVGDQARLLVDHSPQLPPWSLAAIVLLNTVGYVVFRGSNSQKDQFRRDPNHASVKHLKVCRSPAALPRACLH